MGKKAADMTPEQRANRDAYQRRYRQEHKAELDKYHAAKYQRKKNNPEFKEQRRRSYEKNKEGQINRYMEKYWDNPEYYTEKNHDDRVKHLTRRMLYAAKRRAEKLGIPFNITVQDIDEIWTDICPVFGQALSVGKKTAHDWSPSLDRIVPERGYVKGNIQIISNKANMMKQSANPEDLKKFAEWVMRTQGLPH